MATPFHVEVFAATIPITYTPPPRNILASGNPKAVQLVKVRLSDELREESKQDVGVELETVRYLLATVESTSPEFCGIRNFQKDAIVTVNGHRYAVTDVVRASGIEQRVKLFSIEPVTIGSPDK